jgi:hypothetical protein
LTATRTPALNESSTRHLGRANDLRRADAASDAAARAALVVIASSARADVAPGR